ncbi:unnamed protein product [Thelazia callipaeda]|uniref:J domain-containing protein n=1 Tax=Thelazia callipaeda TaxID=103827 RepID=A0A0N5CR38_THECL|nr:unnamed protein product [Thelazia callipaeda]
MNEFRHRIRKFHPDKSSEQTPDIFYEMIKAKGVHWGHQAQILPALEPRKKDLYLNDP